MRQKIQEISVFFPAYNLESQIEKTVRRAYDIIPEIADKYEIIVINDGSKDKTQEELQRLKKEFQDLRIIEHGVNRGYGAALKSGFYNAKYSWIAFTDGDGQFEISELTNFLKAQKETNADLVIGYYRKRRVSTFKIITSKMWEIVVLVLFNLRVRDIDCGFKLISKKVVDSIDRLESERGAFISSELLIKARKKGFSIIEIPVTHYPRVEGKGTGRNLNVIIKSFLDLFRLWRSLR